MFFQVFVYLVLPGSFRVSPYSPLPLISKEGRDHKFLLLGIACAGTAIGRRVAAELLLKTFLQASAVRAGALSRTAENSIGREHILVADSGGNNGNITGIRVAVIIHGAKDDVDIFTGLFLNIACCIRSVCQGNISGDIDDDIRRSVYSRLEQRALNCHTDSIGSLGFALAITDSDMRHALVAHDGLDIRKVEVDDRGHVDQVCDSLYKPAAGPHRPS